MPNVIGILNAVGNGGNATPTTSTVITPIDVKGGVIRNIDQATGDIARTTIGWIEDEKYGVYFVVDAADVSGEFDSTVTQTGRLTGYIKTTSATGKGRFVIGINSGTGASLSATGLSKYGIPIKPSTTYRLMTKIKYSNIANAVILSLHEHDVAGTRLATPGLGNLSGTSDWVEKTISFTSNASTKYAVIQMGAAAAGNAQEFWADINSMTLEEVATINNPLATPVKLYPKATAVTSTDNIDQSLDTGGAYANTYTPPTAIDEGATHRQTFTPTKKLNSKIAAWIVSKGSGDFTLTVHNVANEVQGTPATITNANLTDGAFNDFVNAFDWTSGALHFHITSTVADGTVKTNTANDLEACSFKQQYKKNTTNFTVRTDTETLSVTAPTVEGWANGTVVDTTDGTHNITPLTLAAGDNTVYISSNGSTLADSNTDESLQCTLGGVMVG